MLYFYIYIGVVFMLWMILAFCKGRYRYLTCSDEDEGVIAATLLWPIVAAAIIIGFIPGILLYGAWWLGDYNRKKSKENTE